MQKNKLYIIYYYIATHSTALNAKDYLKMVHISESNSCPGSVASTIEIGSSDEDEKDIIQNKVCYLIFIV